MNNVKETKYNTIILLIIALVLSIIFIGLVSASAADVVLPTPTENINPEYGEIIDWLYNKIGEDDFWTTIRVVGDSHAVKEKVFFDDGSWVYGNFTGCITGWPCPSGVIPYCGYVYPYNAIESAQNPNVDIWQIEYKNLCPEYNQDDFFGFAMLDGYNESKQLEVEIYLYLPTYKMILPAIFK